MRRPAIPIALLTALGMSLGACGIFEKDIPQLPCPKVLILGDAGHLVRFEPGSGRDITDILFEAEIANFVGSCEYTKEGVEIELRITLDVQRGPAARNPPIDFEYFVAIPKYQPRPEGKRVLPVKGAFEDNRSRLLYQDEVDMFLPLEKNGEGPDVEIVLGFQLTPEELEFNRSSRR